MRKAVLNLFTKTPEEVEAFRKAFDQLFEYAE